MSTNNDENSSTDYDHDDDGGDPYPYTDIDHTATARAARLRNGTALSDREALAVAYSNLGFSTSGIAKRTGRSEGTIQQYLDRAAAGYGLSVIETPGPSEWSLGGMPAPITPYQIRTMSHSRRWAYTEVARSHPDRVPNDVLDIVRAGRSP
jgi:hypothetical protein